MDRSLNGPELVRLVRRVFAPGPRDEGLAIIVDLPDERVPDNPDWRRRRALAAEWAGLLDDLREELDLKRVTLAWYRNVGANNADLPDTCVLGTGGGVPAVSADIEVLPSFPFGRLFEQHTLVLAPTELSATAPLKVAARGTRLRAATMPGFTEAMLPALRLDYVEINRRVRLLKELLDRAEAALLRFGVGAELHELRLDLRHRAAHASGGLLHDEGTAGNLPSGEAYIVPYEGERPGDPSRSAGVLPVQIDDEIVLYEIAGNRAVGVLSRGPHSDAERALIAREPAYANLAELGLGVLADFGIAPVGSLLLDEKLGLHVAFGRSDHFGGAIGPRDFTSPAAVIHLDRVYIPQTQPRIEARQVVLQLPDGDRLLMENGRYRDVF